MSEREAAAAYQESKLQQEETLAHLRADRLHQSYIHSEYIKYALGKTDSEAWRQAMRLKQQREDAIQLFKTNQQHQQEKKRMTQTLRLQQMVQMSLPDSDSESKIKSGSTSTRMGKASTVRKNLENEVLKRRRHRFVKSCLHQLDTQNRTRENEYLHHVLTRPTHDEQQQFTVSKLLTYKELFIQNRKEREHWYSTQTTADDTLIKTTSVKLWEWFMEAFENICHFHDLHKMISTTSMASAYEYDITRWMEQVVGDILDHCIQVIGDREMTIFIREKDDVENSTKKPLKLMEYLQLFTSSTQETYPFKESTLPLNTFIGTMEMLSRSCITGEMVQFVYWLTLTLANPSLNSTLPSTAVNTPSLRILILGVGNSGRRTSAKLLSEKYKLTLISIQETIQFAMDQDSALGKKVHSLLTEGKELPPEVYLDVLTETTQQLTAENKGWICYDWPCTLAHAQQLSPMPSCRPNLTDYASILVPGYKRLQQWMPIEERVNVVLYLECKEQVVKTRWLGRLRDQGTDQLYQLYEEPPSDEIIQRLQPLYDSTPMSLEWSTRSANDKTVIKWFHQFHSVYKISCYEDEDAIKPSEDSMQLMKDLDSGLALPTLERHLMNCVEAYITSLTLNQELENSQHADQEQELMLQEETRQRELETHETRIQTAQLALQRSISALQQAEELKAKKEETMELKTMVEATTHELEMVLTNTRQWLYTESLQYKHHFSTYSNDLTPSIAQQYYQLWEELELQYTTNTIEWLRLWETERNKLTDRIQQVWHEIPVYLSRSSSYPLLLHPVIEGMNAIVEGLRYEDTTKYELHARIDILQDTFTKEFLLQFQQNQEEVNLIFTDGWKEQAGQQGILMMLMQVQNECDLFYYMVQFLLLCFTAVSDDKRQLLKGLELVHTVHRILP